MFNKKSIGLFAAALAALTICGTAAAGSATGNVAVSVTLIPSTNSLPFDLSVTNGKGNNFPISVAAGVERGTSKESTLHSVALYGKELLADFKGLPAGAYTPNMTVTVAY